MRSSLAVAAFAASAHAIPAIFARNPKTFTITQIVNTYTTITVDGPAPSHQGHHKGYGGWKSSSVPAANTPPAEAPAPTPQAPQDTPAPAPAPAAPSPVASQGDSGSSGSGNSGLSSYAQTVVSEHNVHRKNHSAPDMSWDQGLADTALKIAQTCSYGHSMNVDGGNYGQNIAAGAPVGAIGDVITGQFYNGEVGKFQDYGQPTPADFDANFESYGHFTQVVWVGSQQVGCATVDCSSQGLKNVASNVPPIFHVCNYKPAGNFIGQFDKNVLRSSNEATHYAS